MRGVQAHLGQARLDQPQLHGIAAVFVEILVEIADERLHILAAVVGHEPLRQRAKVVAAVQIEHEIPAHDRLIQRAAGLEGHNFERFDQARLGVNRFKIFKAAGVIIADAGQQMGKAVPEIVILNLCDARVVGIEALGEYALRVGHGVRPHIARHGVLLRHGRMIAEKLGRREQIGHLSILFAQPVYIVPVAAHVVGVDRAGGRPRAGGIEPPRLIDGRGHGLVIASQPQRFSVEQAAIGVFIKAGEQRLAHIEKAFGYSHLIALRFIECGSEKGGLRFRREKTRPEGAPSKRRLSRRSIV